MDTNQYTHRIVCLIVFGWKKLGHQFLSCGQEKWRRFGGFGWLLGLVSFLPIEKKITYLSMYMLELSNHSTRLQDYKSIKTFRV